MRNPFEAILNTKNRLKYSFQSVFNAVPALHFRDDKVSIAKIRLVPITISQLKCALHILIGDWYELSKAQGRERATVHSVLECETVATFLHFTSI